MSIRIMAEIWDSELSDVYECAVMLALANHADDEGRCYPSVSRVSQLARCSERKVRQIIGALEERGYLTIYRNAGPKGCNVFFVRSTPAPRAPLHDVHPPAPRAPLHDMHPCTPCTQPLHSVHHPPAQRAPEPSENHQEPSEREADASRASAPSSEIEDAITLFNETAERVGLARVQKLTPARRQALKARLREVGGVGGWREAMRRVEASDFLSGRSRDPTHSWRCNFDFLVKQANFTKLMEGNYDNRSGGLGPATPGRGGPGSGLFDACAAVAARRSGRA
ncbi:hypothetical protein NHU_04108 [Rhodovulum sulfidophilum]|uniref:Helix-turn-helix domain-containing protein n=1 Tax=Rhodovulum sulfidophilum TaxID=35806 RepID=A0A0D6B8T2_RHOSU|nr:hypothetical protein NHU_04108 [Rhodovulum sulfidophilum]